MSASPLLVPVDKASDEEHFGRTWGASSRSHRDRRSIGSLRTLAPAVVFLAVGGLTTILFAIYNFGGESFNAIPPFGTTNRQGRHLRKCYPYHEPGQMLLDDSGKHQHTYVSYNGACAATNTLVPRLIHGHPPHHFHDKTILLLGDSVESGLWHYFMGMPGGRSEPLPISSAVIDPPPDYPRADRVYFEAYNLTIGFYWFNGLDENDDWLDTKMIPGSGMWRNHFDRMARIWRGYSPDLIVTQFGLWDLARYQLEKITPSDHVENGYPGLQGRFISDWRRSAIDYLEQLQEAFPQSPTFWRPVHHASRRQYWQAAKVDGMNPFRVQQFRQLQLSVANGMKIPILPLDAMINFQANLFVDAVHPGEVGNAIYAEMVLAALDSTFDSGAGHS